MKDKNQSNTQQGVGDNSKTVIQTQPVQIITNIDTLIERTTESMILYWRTNGFPSMEVCRDTLLDEINVEIDAANVNLARSAKLKRLKHLTANAAARVIMACKTIIHVKTREGSAENASLPLALYVDDIASVNYGIYSYDMDEVDKILFELIPNRTAQEVKLVLDYIRTYAGYACIETDIDLIPLANGIFHYRTKQLLDFSPQYVFIKKSPVKYNPNATNPHIIMPNGEEWDFDSCIRSFAESAIPEETAQKEQLLWQVLGAALRGRVAWDKCVTFYSERGCNGKSTMNQIITDLLSEDNVAAISLDDMSKDQFVFGSLPSKLAIVCDENKVGAYIDDSTNLKKVVTGDRILVRQLYTPGYYVYWRGLVVQAFNSKPKLRDQSDAVYRRFLFIFFKSRFVDNEITEIKQDYVRRQETLEYIVYKTLTLMDDYYEFIETEESKHIATEVMAESNSIYEFCREVFPKIHFNTIPMAMLFSIYQNYFYKDNQKLPQITINTFTSRVKACLNSDASLGEYFHYVDRVRYASQTKTVEPLLGEYKCTNWHLPEDVLFGGSKAWNSKLNSHDCYDKIFFAKDNARGACLMRTYKHAVAIEEQLYLNEPGSKVEFVASVEDIRNKLDDDSLTPKQVAEYIEKDSHHGLTWFDALDLLE